jgi:hypothetical protein
VSFVLRQAVAMLTRHQPELSEQGCLVEVKVLRRERISRQPIHRHPAELDSTAGWLHFAGRSSHDAGMGPRECSLPCAHGILADQAHEFETCVGKGFPLLYDARQFGTQYPAGSGVGVSVLRRQPHGFQGCGVA